jgi:hypothetical protein
MSSLHGTSRLCLPFASVTKRIPDLRYISSRTDEASSLFFSSGTTFEEYAEGGHYRMTKADKRYVVPTFLLCRFADMRCFV